MIARHEKDIKTMIQRIKQAVHRTPAHLPRTIVIYQLPGRAGGSDPREDRCSREFNRILAREAHAEGSTVIEREEMERRLLYRSEFWSEYRSIKPNLHLEAPAPNIIATSMLYLLGCLQSHNDTSTVTSSNSTKAVKEKIGHNLQRRNAQFLPKDIGI